MTPAPVREFWTFYIFPKYSKKYDPKPRGVIFPKYEPVGITPEPVREFLDLLYFFNVSSNCVVANRK